MACEYGCRWRGQSREKIVAWLNEKRNETLWMNIWERYDMGGLGDMGEEQVRFECGLGLKFWEFLSRRKW